MSGFVTRTYFQLQWYRFRDFRVGVEDVYPSVPSAPIRDSKSITVLTTSEITASYK